MFLVSVDDKLYKYEVLEHAIYFNLVLCSKCQILSKYCMRLRMISWGLGIEIRHKVCKFMISCENWIQYCCIIQFYNLEEKTPLWVCKSLRTLHGWGASKLGMKNSIFAAYVTGNRPEGSPIRSVIMGAIWIELDDSMFYYRLITKSQFRRKEQWKKKRICIKRLTKEA